MAVQRDAIAAERDELAARIDAVNQATEEAARRAEARARSGQGMPMGVVKGPDGIILVTGRDGQTIRIDPRVVSDDEEVATIVRTAFAPPAPPSGSSGEDVAIVSIIFPCLIVIMLIVWRMVVSARRPAAAAQGAAISPDVGARLARIEQAIEAVAIEVERISESERYSARLLTERLPDPAADARALATAEAPRGG